MMAAAASAALDYSVPRMPKVHEMTKRVAATIESYGYKFVLPVQTNMIVLDLESLGIPHAAFVDYCKQYAVAVFLTGRLIFHYQTSENGAIRLLKALNELQEDKAAGKDLSARETTGGYA